MRARAAVIAVAAACLASVPSADAAKPRRAMRPYEIEDVNYQFGAPGLGAGVWDTTYAYEFKPRKGEDAVSVMILDDREVEVSGVIVQWVTDFEAGGAGVGHAETYVRFCTKTDAPVPVNPEIKVEILVQKGTCEDGTPSLPTAGDVIVDFHRT